MPDRLTDSTSIRRLLSWLSTSSGVGAVFVLGLAIRLALIRGGGFPFDISSFSAWAGMLADKHPWNFYPFSGQGFFVDYPPGYLYVLWLVGTVSKALTGGAPQAVLLKLPPVLADLGLAWLVAIAAERLAPAGAAKRIPLRAAAAASILLNPAVIFISAIWGQADSVLAVLVVGSFLLLGTGVQTLRREAAGIALLAVAIGTKPQAVFVVPVVVLVLAWRHVRGRIESADGAYERRRAAWSGVGRVALLALAGAAADILLFLPFRLYPLRAVHFYARASGTYKITSVFAFNVWGAVGFWKPDTGAGAVRLLGLPVVFWGIALFVAGGALVCGRAWAALRNGHDEGRVLIIGGVAISLVSFAVVTRVHERYLFLPLALGALLVSGRWARRGFYALTILFLINVYYPYVYYLEFVHRKAPRLGPFYEWFYGGGNPNGAKLHVLSAAVGLACVAMAWAAWKTLEEPTFEARPGSAVPPRPDEIAVGAGIAETAAPDEERPVRRAWTFDLHPIGRRGAAIALAVFAVALVSRTAGLGHPPGMYFDEVYHARTGAEYLGHKEVFEYTHPPLAKELIGFSIQHLSNFNSRSGEALTSDESAAAISSAPGGDVWAKSGGGTALVQSIRIDADCAIRPGAILADLDFRARAIAASDDAVFVAGTSGSRSVLVRLNGSAEAWRVGLPSSPTALAVVSDRAYVVTRKGELVSVAPTGEPETVALGARAIAASAKDGSVWVTFPSDHHIASWDAAGQRKTVIDVGGVPGAIAAHEPSQRVFVSVGNEIVSYDTAQSSEQRRIEGGASLLATVPETTAVWAAHGRTLRQIEPHSGVVIGRTSWDRTPRLLAADPVGHRLVGVADGRLECAGGRPQFAWRLGSALTGSLMVVLVFLLALRLTGNLGAGLLASLFLTVEGLAFTLSRIAMNDSYSCAFMLAAWFSAISALYAWGRSPPRTPLGEPRYERAAAIAWICATGLFAGLSISSKWPGLYALVGIGLLFLWDGFSRLERSIWRVASGFAPSAALIVGAAFVVPVIIYVATYIPYFTLGHSFTDFLRLQRDMYEYHAHLKATHPFSSPWFGWPFGYRSVFLYLNAHSEIWTIPNLVVLYAGLAALVAIVVRAARSRSLSLGIVPTAALLQYLPWIAVTRVTFMYHYLPVVPFLAIALGWWLAAGLQGWRYGRVAALATAGAAVAFFLLVYPLLVGWDMPQAYLDTVKNVIPWVFR